MILIIMGLAKLGTSLIVPFLYGIIEREKGTRVIIKLRSREFNEENIFNATMPGYNSFLTRILLTS